MTDYFENINSFYQILSPIGLTSDIRLRQNTSGGQTSVAPKTAVDAILNCYIERTLPGDVIISTLGQSNDQYKGYLYTTFHQKANTGATSTLDGSYWRYTSSPDNSLTNLEGDFYKQLTDSRSVASGPPVDLTFNIFKTPRLSMNTRNTYDVELFMNAMPSIFASQLTPFFEVEFEYTRLADTAIVNGTKTRFLNRPSLLRFLNGSTMDLSKMPITASDLALIAPFKKKGTQSKPEDSVVYTNMEMFTAPQTLVDMDRLGGSSATRLNPVQPFLPAATLTNGSIKMQGAGAGVFALTYAEVEFKIHDRKRFAEFAEFLRQDPYSSNTVTTWLTYGWLAPRSRGPDDAYAKFVNENMLTKRAFNLINASYSFDPTGQVTVKLNLISPMGATTENNAIQTIAEDAGDSSPFAKIKRDIQRVGERVRAARKILGNSTGNEGTVKMYQVLDAAQNGNMGSGLTAEDSAIAGQTLRSMADDASLNLSEEDKKILKDAADAIEAFFSYGEGALAIKKQVASYFYPKLAACSNALSPDPFVPLPGKKFGELFHYASDLIAETYKLAPTPIDTKFSGKKKGAATPPAVFKKTPQSKAAPATTTTPPPTPPAPPPNIVIGDQAYNAETQQLVGATPAPAGVSKSPAKSIMAQLVEDEKLRAEAANKATNSEPADKENRTPALYAERRIVSFGKIFSVFMLPAIMGTAKNENISEVQVNFYQFNESCGPLSMHNIAEFPIDINFFSDKFNNYCLTRGGESMTLNQFMSFITEYIVSDNRSPGYGMVSFYNAYDRNKPEAARSGNEVDFQTQMAKWSRTYGEFKRPVLSAVVECSSTSQDAFTKSDLLLKLASTVSPPYVKSTESSGKKILKIHIVDTAFETSGALKRKVLKIGNTGAFAVYQTDEQRKQLVTEFQKQLGAGATVTPQSVNVNGVQIIAGGKDVVREFIKGIVPTINFSSNGTMVTNATLASKVDGVAGTLAMLGTHFKTNNTPNPTGLSLGPNNLPMRFLPATLTLNTVGCPLAQLYQEYFLDFDTGTNIDTTYATTQIIHNFSPGKFETSWTFGYSDRHGTFYGAEDIGDAIKALAAETAAPVPAPVPDNATAAAASSTPASAPATGGQTK